jgi:aminotransferase
MLADVAPLGFVDGAEAANAMLERARVAAIPGSAFYDSNRGDKLVRFCFAKDMAALEEAARRMREFR